MKSAQKKKENYTNKTCDVDFYSRIFSQEKVSLTFHKQRKTAFQLVKAL